MELEDLAGLIRCRDGIALFQRRFGGDEVKTRGLAGLARGDQLAAFRDFSSALLAVAGPRQCQPELIMGFAEAGLLIDALSQTAHGVVHVSFPEKDAAQRKLRARVIRLRCDQLVELLERLRRPVLWARLICQGEVV